LLIFPTNRVKVSLPRTRGSAPKDPLRGPTMSDSDIFPDNFGYLQNAQKTLIWFKIVFAKNSF
jgi:hypothetical protein